MRALIWIVFGVFAALWTGGALAAAAFTDWAAGQIAAGTALDLGGVVAAWPVPAWLGHWVDAAAIEAAQRLLVDALGLLRDAWPGLGAVLGWLVPMIWVLWAIGLALLLLLAGIGHWLAARASPPQPSAA